MTKQELRQILIAERKKLSAKQTKDSIIKDKVLNEEHVLNSSNILIYVSKSDEIDTHALIEALWYLRKNVYVPKVINQEIKFFLITSFNDLSLGYFNILEPTTTKSLENIHNSVIIVPGLAYDQNLNRLGYGGGYYDRYLENKDIYKIGLCYQKFLLKNIPTEKHDIKMNLVITD